MSVSVSKLLKRFVVGPGAAVDGVSFDAPSGKITSLLGPSGSGKSTLLRMIAGLEVPDAGSITIDGRDVTELPARVRQIGLVFQSYALFGHMTVRQNIGFGLRIRARPRRDIDARVTELLELVQLGGLGQRLPSELSGGQRQRVALARALAVDPRVLLLDEPFGALDAKVRVELREWLHALHERTRLTTLLVTHDQEEALEMSEHVVLLEAGKVAQAGSPEQLYDHPASPFVASFLGASAVSSMVHEGQARAQDGQERPSGDRVQAFVRPHDVRVGRTEQAPEGTPRAKVERLVRVGGFAKLWLLLPEGDTMSVQITKEELETLGIAPGDEVSLLVRDAKVFGQGYGI